VPAEGLPGVDPVTVYRLGEPLEVFRITKSDRPYDPALLDSFKSNYELGRPARHTEIKFTPEHMGLSVYLALDRARDTARAFPRIGEYVALVRLTPESGAAFALTAEPGHLTVWGRALELVAAVADIVPVEE
jgi:hypothetical protein